MTAKPPAASPDKDTLDRALDEALEETFPASDPPAITLPGADADPVPPESEPKSEPS